MAPAYALLASLAWGLGDFMGGLKSRLMPVLVVMGISQPFGLAALGIAVAVRGTDADGKVTEIGRSSFELHIANKH